MNITEIYEKHQELSNKINTRWKELVGMKDVAYMTEWDVIRSDIRITFEVPLGNGEAWTYHHMIPIECFEVPLEEAKIIIINKGNI